MDYMVKWWSRIAAAVTGATLALVIPAHAWAASNGVAEIAVEAARRRSRGLGFGVLGLVCCLGVVALVVLAIVLISRNRKRR